MEASPTPIVKDLVLVGGGHSHIAVLKKFGMRPVPGVRLTLVCRDVHTPYSGMLPGLIAGHYTYDEAHIDLRKLAVFASARFVHAEVTALDPATRELHFDHRPSIPYDLLSLNTGSTPGTQGVPGAKDFAVPVKPIAGFLPRWKGLLDRVASLDETPRIAVVGAGAGGVELTLAMQYRLRNHFKALGRKVDPSLHVFSATAEILPTHNSRVRRRFARILKERDIAMHLGQPVVEVTGSGLCTRGGWSGEFHEVVWVTDASAAAWLADSGLHTEARGFVRVDECLRSVSHPNVFAAGDVASVDAHPRERAGVFAVRQGPPLEANLRRALQGPQVQAVPSAETIPEPSQHRRSVRCRFQSGLVAGRQAGLEIEGLDRSAFHAQVPRPATDAVGGTRAACRSTGRPRTARQGYSLQGLRLQDRSRATARSP